METRNEEGQKGGKRKKEKEEEGRRKKKKEEEGEEEGARVEGLMPSNERKLP